MFNNNKKIYNPYVSFGFFNNNKKETISRKNNAVRANGNFTTLKIIINAYEYDKMHESMINK